MKEASLQKKKAPLVGNQRGFSNIWSG